MNLVSASYEILTSLGSMEDIERAARVCYKSENKISEFSNRIIVKNLIANKHYAMLEFGHDYTIAIPSFDFSSLMTCFFSLNKFKALKSCNYHAFDDKILMSLNPRSVLELIEDFQEIYIENCGYEEPNDPITLFYNSLVGIIHNQLPNVVNYTPYPSNNTYQHYVTGLYPNILSVTVKLICDRGISHEIVRQRPCSFAQESTRYCNYSKDKFGGVTYILPSWIDEDEKEKYYYFFQDCEINEQAYLDSISRGNTAQKARGTLNHHVKTEIIIKATINEWKHIFSLRSASGAHPQMRELMIPLEEKFKSLKLI